MCAEDIFSLRYLEGWASGCGAGVLRKHLLIFAFGERMAQEFTKGFYGRRAWRRTAETYKKQKIFCERCEKNGILGVPGEIVHHKIELTPMNIDKPEITLNWDNLELVCRNCHALIHSGKERARYTITESGELIF